MAAPNFEVIFVDDGSSDGSSAHLDAIARSDVNTAVIHLSRNFGHQAAVHAGLAHANGDAVVVMDSDLQDDPKAIVAMMSRWRAGDDIVVAKRFGRKENALKRGLFFAFYRVLNALSDTPMPTDSGNFGLVDRKVARQLTHLREQDRYYAGLRTWVGFRQSAIAVQRGARYDDNPRVSLLGLFRLAKSAVISFSRVPLLVFYALASLSGLAFAFLGSFTLYHRLFTGLAIPGWTSNVMVGCFFGALNALGIAILGEYVVRIYDQVRGRPTYIVDRVVESNSEKTSAV